jgi:hypothetical protein
MLNSEQGIQTARELRLMRSFPPSTEGLVTHANQLAGPYNRWSFQNELPLNCVVGVWRGDGPLAPLPYTLRDLGSVTCRNRAGNEFYSAFSLPALGAWLAAQV